MKTLVLRKGRGKVNETTGNFTGFTLIKEKVFVHAKTLDAAALPAGTFDENGVPTVDLYVLAQDETINAVAKDANGEVIEGADAVVVDRLTAAIISSNVAELHDVANESEILAFEASMALAAKKASIVKASKLSGQELDFALKAAAAL